MVFFLFPHTSLLSLCLPRPFFPSSFVSLAHGRNLGYQSLAFCDHLSHRTQWKRLHFLYSPCFLFQCFHLSQNSLHCSFAQKQRWRWPTPERNLGIHHYLRHLSLGYVTARSWLGARAGSLKIESSASFASFLYTFVQLIAVLRVWRPAKLQALFNFCHVTLHAPLKLQVRLWGHVFDD